MSRTATRLSSVPLNPTPRQISTAINYLLENSPFGYTTGVGGTVTQATSKSTAVTLNKLCGQITTSNASLASATSVSFTFTNSQIAATDLVVVNIASGATTNAYLLNVTAVAAGSCRLHLRNLSGGTLGEALVINFAVVKAVNS